MRQFADEAIGDRFQMNERNEVGDRLHDRVACARADEGKAAAGNAAAGEIDVLAHREPLEQQRNLVGAPKSAADALVRRQCGHVLAEETHRARRRRKIAGHAIEQRRLAGAIRSEHGAPLAGTHAERDVGQGCQRAEQTAHAAQFNRVAGAGGGQSFGDRAHAPFLPPALRARATHRRHRPMTPSGENKTMTRKARPISVWKRRPSSPIATSDYQARKVRRTT